MGITIIEGSIGVGKTTTLNKLSQDNSSTTITNEVTDENLLDNFYQGRDKGGVQLQEFLLKEGIKNFEWAIKEAYAGKSIIMDRSFISGIPFIHTIIAQSKDKEVTKQLKEILQQTQEAQKSILNVIEKKGIDIDVIYLDASPETQFKRIIKRGRECEQDISIEYLKKLKKNYDKFIQTMYGLTPKVVNTEKMLIGDGRDLIIENLVETVLQLWSQDSETNIVQLEEETIEKLQNMGISKISATKYFRKFTQL